MSPVLNRRDRRPRDRTEEQFIKKLVELTPPRDEQDPLEAKHRAIRAELRRGLGKEPGTALAMYPFVGPLLPTGADQREEDAYFLIASLFGLHPHHLWPAEGSRHRSNLGSSFARLKRQEAAGDPAREKPIERRFITVLNASTESLGDHLRQVIGLLRSKEVAVDYLQLLRDVQAWGAIDRYVQRAWAGAFWGRSETETTTGTAGEDESNDTAPTEDE